MNLTKLQKNEQIYQNLYAIVHNEVWRICQLEEDSEHLLVDRFNEIQEHPGEFQKDLLELFYGSGSAFLGNYLRMTATDYWNNLSSKEYQELFTKEFVSFLKFFED